MSTTHFLSQRWERKKITIGTQYLVRGGVMEERLSTGEVGMRSTLILEEGEFLEKECRGS